MFKYLYKKYNTFNTSKLYYSNNSNEHSHDISKIGQIKHYPPITRVWNNSVYNFNKNNKDDSFAKYNRLSKIINNYFNLHNNVKLARSKRMRYLRIKSVSKRLYVSKPEVKQTNDKIIITVYYFDKLKHSFTRKNFFFNRPSIVKYILNKKHGKRNYKKKALIRKTKLLEKRVKYLGIKQIRELKLFKERNKFKNKYIEQSLLFYFFKYILSLINIQIYNPIQLSNNYISKNNINKYMKFIMQKESIKVNNTINSNPKLLLWINLNNYSFEKIDNINYINLITRVINEHNQTINNASINNNSLAKLNFIAQTNRKLLTIVNNYSIKNILSESIILKIYNYISIRVYKNFAKKMFYKQYNKISKLTYLSMSNVIKFKYILPTLKMVIDTFYNKKTELNMVNLKYYYLNSDILTQALIVKLKKKVNPSKTISKSIGRAKAILNHNIRKRIPLNNIDKLYKYADLSVDKFPANVIQNSKEFIYRKDWLQIIFNKLFPNNLLQKYKKSNEYLKKKISNVLNDIKYKGILGIRIEAKGRLTRRHKAARSIQYITHKGNLRDNDWYFDKDENFERSIPTVLLRNDIRANTQYISKPSVRRIGSFGIKTWISGK